jgi:hypothetical protein
MKIAEILLESVLFVQCFLFVSIRMSTLYKATNDQQYLNDAKGWFNSGTAWGYSWDDQNVGCQVQTDAAYKSFGGFNSSLHSDLLDNVDIRMDTKRKH